MSRLGAASALMNPAKQTESGNVDMAGTDDTGEEAATDERSIFNSIPIANFKSNHLSRKKNMYMGIEFGGEETKFDAPDMTGQMSPGASHAVRDLNFKHIDHKSHLSQAIHGFKKFQISKDPSQQSSGAMSPRH